MAERDGPLEVARRKCARRGVLSVAQTGAEVWHRMPMTELRRVLAGDCERLKAATAHSRAGAISQSCLGCLGWQRSEAGAEGNRSPDRGVVAPDLLPGPSFGAAFFQLEG
jgi:hypothetical protein